MHDLGVIFDLKLSGNDHVMRKVAGAFKTLGFILRIGRDFGDVATLKLLYVTLVRSRLESFGLIFMMFMYLLLSAFNVDF